MILDPEDVFHLVESLDDFNRCIDTLRCNSRGPIPTKIRALSPCHGNSAIGGHPDILPRILLIFGPSVVLVKFKRIADGGVDGNGKVHWLVAGLDLPEVRAEQIILKSQVLIIEVDVCNRTKHISFEEDRSLTLELLKCGSWDSRRVHPLLLWNPFLIEVFKPEKDIVFEDLLFVKLAMDLAGDRDLEILFIQIVVLTCVKIGVIISQLLPVLHNACARLISHLKTFHFPAFCSQLNPINDGLLQEES